MALALIVETGSGLDPTANTFGSLAGAIAYHESVIESAAWDTADEATRNKALVQASRILTNQFSWEGYRSQPATQPLAFPRRGAYCDGVLIDDDVVPRIIEEATYELARDLIAFGAFQVRPATAGGADQIKSIGVGKGAVEVEYQDQAEIGAASAVAPYVEELVRCLGYLRGRGNFRSIPVQR